MENKDEIQDEVFVKIEKSKLDSILNRIESLEKEVSGVNELKPVAKNTARMRKIDDKIVIGFEGKNWNVYNKEERKEEMWATLILIDKKGKTTTRKVDYVKFLEESEVIEVDIIKQNVKIDPVVQGEVEVKKVVDYRTVGTDDYVPMVLETPITTAVVMLPEVGEYELSIDSLNI